MTILIYALAETIVMCNLRVKKGLCVKKSCAGCGTWARLSDCMDQLPKCDWLPPFMPRLRQKEAIERFKDAEIMAAMRDVVKDNAEIARLLLDAGANMDNYGGTALDMAEM